MRSLIVPLLLLGSTATATAAGQPEWKPLEKIESYAISGQSAGALYASIGERGPVIRGGSIRAIAYTDYKLTWQRRYENPDGGCLLAAAKPSVTIVYRLPKPAEKLSPQVKANWEAFYGGIVSHERQHGEFILSMVRRIEAETVGLRADDDPSCKKVRAELNRRLAAAGHEKGQRDLAFDKAEMSDGGNVHRLVLAFVNGY